MKTKESFVTNSSSSSFIIGRLKASDEPCKIRITLEFTLNNNNLLERYRNLDKDLLELIEEVENNGGSIHELRFERDSVCLLPTDQFNTEETKFIEFGDD